MIHELKMKPKFFQEIINIKINFYVNVEIIKN